MRRIVLGTALVAVVIVAPSLAAAWHSGEVVVDGYRLPRDHRFESPDAAGKYNVVNLNDVPGADHGWTLRLRPDGQRVDQESERDDEPAVPDRRQQGDAGGSPTSGAGPGDR